MLSKPIVLTGFMGVGKTTLGQQLAKDLNVPFVDTDHVIEKDIGMSIAAFFESHGEDAFRQKEQQLVTDLCTDSSPQVIALGGGALAQQHIVDFIKTQCTLVYLKQDVDTLFKILCNAKAQRPKIAQLDNDELHDFISALLSQREPMYSQAHLSFVPQYSPIQTDIDRLIHLLQHDEIISTKH